MPLRQRCRVVLSACCFAALFCLFVLPVIPLAAPHPALALSYDSPISITSQSTSINFPTSISFTVSVNDTSSNIVSAEIVINLQNFSGPETHDLAVGTPHHSLKLTWNEMTTGNDFVPPGTPVDYFWHFTDSAGATYFQPNQSLTTYDTRFAWQHLNRGLLQVNWYGRSPDFGQIILNQASSSLDSISTNLGGGLIDPINLWVYASDADFHGSLPPNSYEWVGGIAFPSLKEAEIVVADSSDLTLIRDMPHELTHLVFHQLIGLQTTVPTWLDEGLAVDNQQYHESEMTARLREALASHSLLRLDSISFGFPADADQAYLAYAQSWNLVQYMYSTFGTAKMIQFIKNLGNPSLDFNQAMVGALGIDAPHLENQWRLHLNQPGIPLPPGQITPTPAATARPATQPTPGAVSGNSDDRSWGLILLGGVLVLASISGLIVLVVYQTRSRRRAGDDLRKAGTANAQLYQNGIPPFDPSVYARNSMYMQPTASSPQRTPMAGQPAQPVQPAQAAWPQVTAGQEYSNYRPGSSSPEAAGTPHPKYPQAPQE